MKKKARTSFKQFLLFAFSLGCTTIGLSQQKFERESTISKENLPPFALNFEAKLTDVRKVKWYLEEGFYGKSIEAKYRSAKKKYSVEFDTTGRIEDVEVETRLHDLNELAQATISSRLDNDGEKYKIDKIQIQYSGEQALLEKFAISGERKDKCEVRYEIVARIKQEKKLKSFEYLFDEDGVFIQRVEIVIQTSSNLEY